MAKEYIERQRAIVDACNSLELYPSEYAKLEDTLNRIPTADVVEVVRCKDCAYWTKIKDSAQGRCALFCHYPTGSWYCANGERKKMSKEYICREEALSAIKQAFEKGEGPSLYIKRIPAADVAPVRHGEWLKAEDDYCGLNIIQCSICHEEWCFEIDDDVIDLNYHYCPNCGAKMDKEQS